MSGREIKSTGIAIILSFFWTGLGQLYSGRIGRGITMMIITPFVYFFMILGFGSSIFAGAAASSESAGAAGGFGVLGVAFIAGWLFWWVWGMMDARRLCERFNEAGAE